MKSCFKKLKIFSVKFLIPEILAVLAALIIMCNILIIQPAVGVADNGDFERIMGAASLEYTTSDYNERYFNYFHRQYNMKNYNPMNFGGFLTTQLIPLKIAVLTDIAFTRDSLFDTRFQAAIYIILMLISIYMLVKLLNKNNRLGIYLLTGLILIIFFDVGYIAYFNSLYGEPASYVYFFLTIASVLYLISCDKPKNINIIVLLICSFLFAAAKQQNAPIAIIISIYCLRLWNLRKDKRWKMLTAIVSTFLLITAFAIYASIPTIIRYVNQYQTVTLGIIKDSPTPEKDLEELGIDPKYAILKNTTYFDNNPVISPYDPVLIKEFTSKISYSKVLLFYIKHPVRFIQKMEITAQNAFSIRPGYLGNYEKATGAEPGQKAGTFGLWSRFKEKCLPHTLFFVIPFYILFFIILFLKYIRANELKIKLRLELLAMIAVIGASQFVLPMLGDGEGDLAKHLFMFNVCFDIMFIVLIVWAADKARKQNKQRELELGNYENK